MKVIFLKNVDKAGKAGEIKQVADGFALNYLLPKKLAVAATEQEIKKTKNQEAKKSALCEKTAVENEKLMTRLAGLNLNIKAKASESGKLFAGLSAEDIARELKAQKNIDIAAKHIRLEKHIKTTGEYKVEISLGKDKKPNIIVMVNGL